MESLKKKDSSSIHSTGDFDKIAEKLSDKMGPDAPEEINIKKVLAKHPEIKSLLLITSAIHMPRAKACFTKAGFTDFDTFTTDHYTGKERAYKLDQFVVPNVSTLVCWKLLIKEWIGYTVYWMMGYL